MLTSLSSSKKDRSICLHKLILSHPHSLPVIRSGKGSWIRFLVTGSGIIELPMQTQQFHCTTMKEYMPSMLSLSAWIMPLPEPSWRERPSNFSSSSMLITSLPNMTKKLLQSLRMTMILHSASVSSRKSGKRDIPPPWRKLSPLLNQLMVTLLLSTCSTVIQLITSVSSTTRLSETTTDTGSSLLQT